MRTLILNYIGIRKAGLFKNGNVMFIIIILPSFAAWIIGENYIGMNSTIPYIVTLTALMFFNIVPLTTLGNLSLGKYITYATLPIKNLNLIAFTYIKTYTVISAAFIVREIINSLFLGMPYVAVDFFCFALSLCLSNLFIPMQASGEFRMPMEGQVTVIIAIIFSIITLGSIALIILLLNNPQELSPCLNQPLFIATTVFFSLTMVSIAILTIKKSFLTTVKKVRLMD